MPDVWDSVKKFEKEHPKVAEALKSLGMSQQQYQKAIDARAPVVTVASHTSGWQQKGK